MERRLINEDSHTERWNTCACGFFRIIIGCLSGKYALKIRRKTADNGV